MNTATIALMLLIASGSTQDRPAPDIAGNWIGRLSVQGMQLRLGLRVSRDADGKIVARLDSLDQGANDLPVDEIEQRGRAVRFAAKRIGLSYSGTLSEDGRSIAGELQQGSAVFPLTFERAAAVAAPNRPQEPARPFPYLEHHVSYASGPVTLAGTLTVPRGAGPHPAVLLITGSGAQDRDETIAGHRPFLVLADYLTRRGIAVLRVDDRGVGKSTAGSAEDTSETYAGDALAALAFLSRRADIDARRIGLIGHSEGANVAAIAASRSTQVAFVVMMAGMGQTGEDVIMSQTELGQRAAGVEQTLANQTRSTLKQIFATLRGEPDRRAAVHKMRGVLDSQAGSLGPVAGTLRGQLDFYATGWFRYFLDYDPAIVLRKVTVPVLAVTGELDMQAPSQENLKRIAAALKEGGNPDATVRELPRLNHLFQTARTGLPNEYHAIEETIAPAALQEIGDWVAKRAAARRML